MTPSPENNEAEIPLRVVGQVIGGPDAPHTMLQAYEQQCAALRDEADKLRAERDAKQLVLNERGLELDDWKRHHLALAQECDTLRQQLTNAIDERNIARKESTAVAQQLAAATKERDYHKQVFLSDWQENEAALEKAGIDFTPDESGGKPVIVGIEELIVQRDEAVAQRRETDAALASIKRFQDEAAPLRQRITELEAALGGLIPFVMEEYHPDYATPDFKAAVEHARAATAPDAQSGATP